MESLSSVVALGRRRGYEGELREELKTAINELRRTVETLMMSPSDALERTKFVAENWTYDQEFNEVAAGGLFLSLCGESRYHESFKVLFQSDLNKRYVLTRYQNSNCLSVATTKRNFSVLKLLMDDEDVSKCAIPRDRDNIPGALGLLEAATMYEHRSDTRTNPFFEILFKDNRPGLYAQPNANQSQCLTSAARTNDVFSLTLLLSDTRPDKALPRSLQSECLSVAAKHASAFEILFRDSRPGIYALPNANGSRCLISAIGHRNEHAVRLILSDKRPEKALPRDRNSECLVTAAQCSTEIMLMLLKDRREGIYALPNAQNSLCFRKAITAGRTECVKFMLTTKRPEKADPRVEDSRCLTDALRSENIEIFEMLLKDPRAELRAQPNANESDCLITAIELANVRAVELLMKDKRADKAEPRARDSVCLRVAADIFPFTNESLSILSILLSDTRKDFYAIPSAQNSQCLINAIKSANLDAIKMLLSDTRPDAVDASANDSEALILAINELSNDSLTGHAMVELLMNDKRPGLYAKPNARNSYSIWLAAGEEANTTKLLLDDTRPERAQPDVIHRGDSVLERAINSSVPRALVATLLLDGRAFVPYPRSLSDPRTKNGLMPYPTRLYYSFTEKQGVAYFNAFSIESRQVLNFAKSVYTIGEIAILEFNPAPGIEFDDFEEKVIEAMTEFFLCTGYKLPSYKVIRLAWNGKKPIDIPEVASRNRLPFTVTSPHSDVAIVSADRARLFEIEDSREETDAQGRYVFYRDMTEITRKIPGMKDRRDPRNIPRNKRLRFKSDQFALKAIRSREALLLQPGTYLYHGGSDRIKRGGKCCYFLSHSSDRAMQYSQNRNGELHAYKVSQAIPALHEWTWTLMAVVWDKIKEGRNSDSWSMAEHTCHNYMSTVAGFNGRWSMDSEREVMLVPSLYSMLEEDLSKRSGYRERRPPGVSFFDDIEATVDDERFLLDLPYDD